MTSPPEDPKPAKPDAIPADQPASAAPELESEMYRVLFDHEMDRGTGITRIPQPRRRRRLPPAAPAAMPSEGE